MSCIRIFYLSFLCLLPSDISAQDDAYLPLSEGNLQVRHTFGFILAYSEPHEQAAWVAYELTAQEVAGGVGRTDDFRSDHDIKTGSSSLADYKGSGYDRGHLAPAADMSWSRTAMSQSFFLSNMSPQLPAFNRGIWRSLESAVRGWAESNGSVYVVTGPIFASYGDEIGSNGVDVPTHYWKALYDPSEGLMVGFMLPHAKGDRPLRGYATSVDAIESATGLDLFASLPDKLEDRLEGSSSLKGWPALSSSGGSRSSSSSPAPRRSYSRQTPASGSINVNTASRSELESLPDIGPVIAGRIIAGRPWRSVGALIRVKGIGEKRLSDIRGLVTVN